MTNGDHDHTVHFNFPSGNLGKFSGLSRSDAQDLGSLLAADGWRVRIVREAVLDVEIEGNQR